MCRFQCFTSFTSLGLQTLEAYSIDVTRVTRHCPLVSSHSYEDQPPLLLSLGVRRQDSELVPWRGRSKERRQTLTTRLKKMMRIFSYNNMSQDADCNPKSQASVAGKFKALSVEALADRF